MYIYIFYIYIYIYIYVFKASLVFRGNKIHRRSDYCSKNRMNVWSKFCLSSTRIPDIGYFVFRRMR